LTAPTTARDPRPLLHRLLGAQESGLVVVIALVVIALAIFGGTKPKRVQDAAGEWTTTQVNSFLDTQNLVLVAKDASFIAIMAVGMTAVIITAGIDLSIGSIYGLAAILGAMALKKLSPEASWFVTVPAALAICMSIGALCGTINGSLIVGLRVHPFVITLGMLAALRGITILFPKELLGTQSIGGFPHSFTKGFFKAEFAGLYPVPAILMLCVTAIGWLVLSKTVFGRRIYAIGGNETAARYAGVPVKRVLVAVYALTGMLAGLSACVYLGYLGAAETSAGSGYELRVIAACVIGGASLMGGRGTAIGAMLGAILVELISNAMIILQIDQDYNQIVMGTAIILAVVIDQSKARLRRRK
jgi:ribose/xylose/arabinose/galactoside ABC-type transport system permease subunit